MRIAVMAAVIAGLAGPALADAGVRDVYVLGEVHDNPAHHLAQAAMVAEIVPAAVVFEMLEPRQVLAAEGVDRLDIAALEQALGWNGSGWPDFDMYHPIFAAAPDAVIYGAALPRAEVMRAAGEGALAVFGPEAEAYGLGPLDAAEQAARETEQFAAHCDALPMEMMAGMVEAQRLRDAHFARVALQALDETGGPVAVITGNEHARLDRGIPHAVALARPEVRLMALGQYEREPLGDVHFDSFLVSDPVDRGDPCEAFQ